MTQPLRVLYYNWADYSVPGQGGGVSVYQRNLMHEIGSRRDVEAVLLTSGVSYDLPARTEPRWQKVRASGRESWDTRFEIVNSGVMAPAHHAFGHAAQLDHPATRTVFLDFLQHQGPFDVVHFNNLEGVPASVLNLDEIPVARRPKVVVSLHNYFPFCPQVNLWQREEKSCTDFENGRACASCLETTYDARAVRIAKGLSYRLKRAGLQPGRLGYDLTYPAIHGAGRRAAVGLAHLRANVTRAAAQDIAPLHQHFADRRRAMIDLLNTHCDHVLCVSDAVHSLAREFGIRRELLQTSYIGSREASRFDKTAPRPLLNADGTLSLAFLGYMRRDKGFFFLLQALEALPAHLAKRLRLLVCAKRGDGETMARLAQVGQRLAGLSHVDGYAHGDLDDLLANVGVGLIPVLWHDNLPQVAIEMHARHIPLLCSDMGGAQELGRCSDMVFPAGSTSGFADRIAALLDGHVDITTYWQNARPPVAMQAHIEELLRLYRS